MEDDGEALLDFDFAIEVKRGLRALCNVSRLGSNVADKVFANLRDGWSDLQWRVYGQPVITRLGWQDALNSPTTSHPHLPTPSTDPQILFVVLLCTPRGENSGVVIRSR